MSDITIVCCYNNKEQFEKFIGQFPSQTITPEIISIDNTSNNYTSCASAFNSVTAKISTPYVIFSHQDIIFESPNVISDFIQSLEKITSKDILGVAGVKADIRSTFSNIYDGIANKKQVGQNRVNGLEECETVDECFFGGYTEYFKENPFDEVICNNWHLYAVEQCLRAKKLSGKVYVCSLDIYHYSEGAHNSKLHDNFLTLSKAYHKDYAYICTPCCRGNTGLIRRNWGHYVRNTRLGIKPENPFKRKALGLIRKATKKSKFVHFLLFGDGIFK